MPRWASRITLEITNMQVEQVQEISADNAIAEGVKGWDGDCGADPDCVPTDDQENQIAIDQFHSLWDSINDARGFGWELNCWVWVITFKMIR